jgi:hypothetical protein
VGPGAMRGPSIASARRRGVATRPVAKGATSGGATASIAGRRGPGMAEASQSARSMLPTDRGPALPLPGATVRPRHFSVPDSKGSEQKRPLGWRSFLHPVPVPQGAEDLLARVP